MTEKILQSLFKVDYVVVAIEELKSDIAWPLIKIMGSLQALEALKWLKMCILFP